MRKQTVSLATMVIALILAPAASAHPGHGLENSFSGGFMHPLTGWDHLTALLLLGIMIGMATRKFALQLAGLFALALTGGFMLGTQWSHTDHFEIMVTGSLLAFPLAYRAYRAGGVLRWGALAAIALFSASHGVVQGAESTGSATGFGIGTLTSSLLVIAVTAVILPFAIRLYRYVLPAGDKTQVTRQ